MRRLASHVMVILLLASALTAAGLPSPARAAGTCGTETLVGDGSFGAPFQVEDEDQLRAIGTGDCDLDKHYVQTANITLTGPWTPIGTFASPFIGSYDGDGRTISNMNITGTNILGMFGQVSGAAVSALSLIGTVSATSSDVGMLAGRAIDSIITNVTISANVSSTTTNGYVGGLIGFADDITVSASSVTGSVTAQGNYVGGLVGYAQDITVVTASSVTGSVTVPLGDSVGGLVGYASGPISLTNSSNHATVSAKRYVGGFIGRSLGVDATIEGGVNSGAVIGSSSDVGGFVGRKSPGHLNLVGSTNSATVSGSGDEVGGLVGSVGSSGDLHVTSSTNTGAVTGGDDYVGGIAGLVERDLFVTSSANTGTVRAAGDDYAGGIAGLVEGDLFVTSSANTGAVSAYDDYVGGLLGNVDNDTVIVSSTNTGAVSGDIDVGGLVGYSEGHLTVNRSWSTGNISGTLNVGGLVGEESATYDATISASFARGSVTASATPSQVGGLLGTATGFTIENSYFAGTVATTGSVAGGLVGYANNPTLTNSYSSGSVTASSDAGPLTGQVAGTPAVSATFWNAADSGLSGPDVGPSVDLTDIASFAGWTIVDVWEAYDDPTSIWGICSEVNSGRPFLLWEYETDPCVPDDVPDDDSDSPSHSSPPRPAGPMDLAGGIDQDEAAVAAAVSKLLDKALIVFLVSRNAPADAVVAAAYGAGAGGPVLVTDTDQVPVATLNEIKRLGATQVIVIGGEERVSSQVMTQLRDLLPGVVVERIAGGDRLETAVEASRRRFPTGNATVYLAATDAPADALIAAAQAAPVLYTFRTTVPQVTLAELERLSPNRIVVVGGPARVDHGVITALIGAFPTADVSRLGGADRFETAAMFTNSSQRRVLLIDGHLDRVGSIAAAATAALRNIAILFTERTCAPPATHRLLDGRRVLTLGPLGTRMCG